MILVWRPPLSLVYLPERVDPGPCPGPAEASHRCPAAHALPGHPAPGLAGRQRAGGQPGSAAYSSGGLWRVPPAVCVQWWCRGGAGCRPHSTQGAHSAEGRCGPGAHAGVCFAPRNPMCWLRCVSQLLVRPPACACVSLDGCLCSGALPRCVPAAPRRAPWPTPRRTCTWWAASCTSC
jgi:hypothetical protein